MNAEPRQGQLPVGPLVAAIGALLLVVSLMLDWYEEITGFTVFEFIDLLLVLIALATLFALAAETRLVRAALAPGLSLALALLALFVVVSQILNDPPAVAGGDGPDQALGIWLALAGAALMVAGAVLGSARISLAVESRPRTPVEPDLGPRRTAGTGTSGDDPTRPLADPEAPPPPRGTERP